MEGRRAAQPSQAFLDEWGITPKEQKRSSGAGWVVLGIVGITAALVVGGIAGLGMYVNHYDRVFPGVTLGEESLAGYTREELEAHLASGDLLAGQVSFTADGETLDSRTQQELGAYIESGRLADAAWAVGREEGASGWFRNIWTMVSGKLGGQAHTDVKVLYDDAKLQAAVADIAAGFDREAVDSSYELTREGIYATRGIDGRRLDQAQLRQDIAALKGGSGTVEAQWTAIPGQGLDMDELALELNAEPSKARYDIEQGKVVDGVVGVHLDSQAAEFALEAAAPGETILLPAQVVYPEMTAQELQAVLFRDELSSTSTKLSGSRNRQNNVKLAAACIDGLILNDGDVFDYNKVVGRRTAERGFAPAPAYINGETVDTIGGGICQVSSTIYYATLLANLEIVERYAHRYTPDYITWGMDATVSWGGPEFRFKNDTGYPMRIDISCDNGEIKVTLIGTKTDDTYVKMTYEDLGSTGYETEYIETNELDWGTQQVKQTAYTGHKVVSYRSVYAADGTLISRTQEAVSNYKSRNKIILVGTRGKPVAGTTMPEFGGDSADDEPVLPSDEPALPNDGSPGLSIFG